jgi:type I restriction enzyme M protein
MSLSTLIKTIQDIMRKDVGVDGDAQRISQMVWLLFLKIFDDREQEWKITIKGYKSPLQSRFQWSNWAANSEGMTGEELIDFVNNDLFPSLKKLATTAGVSSHGKVIGSVFEDAYNYMKSGTLLRQVINTIQTDVDFNSSADRHVFNDIYEKILNDLQSAGNSGEYYTPRAVTQFMVDILNPQLGEIVFDPACGTGGFLVNAVEHIKKQFKTSKDSAKLQETIHGVEKKPLPHMLAMTNVMLHGIDIPINIRHDNTLSRPLKDYGPKDRVDVIITNPPFGGMEEDGIEKNFPKKYQTRETADLFMALIMHLLRADTGRAAVVLPDGFLFGEATKTTLKRELLNEFNLHTIVRLPNGVFSPYTNIKTNILFFDKSGPTKYTWFFEHPYPAGYKSYSRGKPLTIDEFKLEKKWWKQRKKTEYAWKISASEIEANNYNLDFKNPHFVDIVHRNPDELMQEFKSILKSKDLLRDSIKAKLPKLQDSNSLIKYFDNLYSTPESIQKLKNAILKLGVMGKLVPQNPKDHPASELIKEIIADKEKNLKINKKTSPGIFQPINSKEVPYSIPQGWEWCRLGTIAEYIQRGKGPVYSELEEIPVISQKCIQWSGFNKDVVKFVSPGTIHKYQPERFIQEDDLLWNSTGTGTIGRINIYKNELNKFSKIVADSHVTVIRTKKINQEYLLKFLMSPVVQTDLEERASGTTNQIELNTSMVKNQLIPVPPLNEQKRIVQKIDELIGLCDSLEKQINDANSKQMEILNAVLAQI